jgi:hypothetical protein
MNLRLRYHTLKLRAFMWLLRRLMMRAARSHLASPDTGGLVFAHIRGMTFIREKVGSAARGVMAARNARTFGGSFSGAKNDDLCNIHDVLPWRAATDMLFKSWRNVSYTR